MEVMVALIFCNSEVDGFGGGSEITIPMAGAPLLFCCTDDTPLSIFLYLRRFGHRFVMYRVKKSSKIAHQRKPGATCGFRNVLVEPK